MRNNKTMLYKTRPSSEKKGVFYLKIFGYLLNMKRVIKLSESDLNRIVKRVIEEQSFGYGPGGSMSLSQASKVQKVMSDYYNENPHYINQIMQFGTAFIPLLGPFISAGIGLADAGIYYKEGKNSEAGVAAFFALLPGIGTVVLKIPGVKELGQKGMQTLASKLFSQAPLNAVEQGVVGGINLNKELIKQETNNLVKNMASKVVAKIEDPAIQKKLINLSKDGIQMKAENTAMNMAATQPIQAGTTGKGTYNPLSVTGNYKPGGTTKRT